VPDPGRPPDITALTSGELERTRRDLAISMALIGPGSPAAIPIAAHINAIDTELAQRTSAGQTGSPR
jgi:hypothetical protein